MRAYSTTADTSNGLSGDELSAAAGQRRVMANMCSGLVVYAIADIACGRTADLISATENLRQDLSDATRRRTTIRTIGELQEANQYAFVAPVANRLRHAGGSAIRSGAYLIDDLRRHFANAYFRDHAIRGYLNDFAEIGLTFRGNASDAGPHGNGSDTDSDREVAEGHSIVVQRLRPSAHYEHDEYQVYDSNFGAFRYRDFAQMSAALRALFDTGYREFGGIDHADTTLFANLGSEQRVVLPGPALDAPRGSPVACLPLGSVERALGIGGSPAMTPPHAALPTSPAPPDIGPPRLPLYPGHDELKRGLPLAADRKPYALFRPSSVRPETVKARGGFDSEQTKLRDIDMNLHDADLASRPHVTDSAGYLGTFRSERVALGRLPERGAHFIYYVAPAPNMIDVRASLGSGARAPGTGEVAAMGRIDMTQIRGWRMVENGVPGAFVTNPDYRWDVYDQTRIARAQPQLARFPVASDSWQQARFRQYVSGGGDANARRFKQDPNIAHAAFYDSAWQKIRELQMRQSMGVDYRGPMTLLAYGGSRWRTHIFVDELRNVLADSAYTRFSARPGNRHEFTMGDDGRFHVAGDDRSVLRVGNDGYVYLGKVPDNPASLNGVFAYDGHHLIHQEDDKFLTIGKTVYTPFVTTEDYGSRSDWRLERPDRRRAAPPAANLHTYRGKDEGSGEQLHAFECDPDSALPDSADHFVTSVRGNAYRGDFSAYVDRITARDVRDAARALDAAQAAWLFRDGYYAIPDGAGGLEVRTLGGKAVWRSAQAFAAVKRGAQPDRPVRTAASYRIGNDTWQRIQRRESLRAHLVAMMTQAYFVN
ncbi:enterotoxin A family protein [Paraburkholderia rhizosphaerae]|uniref:enterotoxin A family protein n=1 Tax=Paraburkholderia rhizosphaerae TaxID=480658 RepID=UPI001416F8DB|nr:enterotoxin A family protein [Paraburkholderia rhizosphaerae]